MIKVGGECRFAYHCRTFTGVSTGFYMRPFIRLLFIFVTYGILGWNTFQLVMHPSGTMEQPDGLETFLDFGDEESEPGPSGAYDEDEAAGSKALCFSDVPTPSCSLFYTQEPLVFYPVAAVRQSQINLQNSRRLPPVYLLHQSFQGYLPLV